jgi:endonuclease/exonuclease/phosphatase (EEP) superfamily protein YafD
MKQLKKLLRILLHTICFISLAGLLLSAFSDRISPLTCFWIPYFGLFFPFILGFNLLVLGICLLFKQWKTVVLFVIVFLFCSGSIHTYFPVHTKTKQVPETGIKILTYNVMRFNLLHQHTPNHPNPIIEYMVNNDADIICIQEYAALDNNKKWISNQTIANALKTTPYRYFLEISPSYGLALFSKYPVLKAEKIPFESRYNGAFVAELDINGRKVTLVNCHLESNQLSGDEREEYYDMTKNLNSENLEAFTHTMHKRLTPAFKKRAKQAEMIAQIIAKNKNPYIIVCGDFNDTPLSYARYKIKGDLEDAFVESGRGMGITYNMYRFLFRIDYILHTKNMKAYNSTVGKLKDSDHYPVSTYLEFTD